MKVVEKDRHVLYVHEVKTIREIVNLKIQELRDDIEKEFAELDHKCSNLHNKVDILVVAITKVMEWHTTLPSQVEQAWR